MNLIEQLGGYDAAKEWYKDQDLMGGHTVKIRAALLEYRRQHNIFEVGDWIKPKIRIVDQIEGVGSFICAEKGELIVVREVKTKGIYASHESRLDNSFYMSFHEFEHAKDEEIKAGKRLEVNDGNAISHCDAQN